MKRRRMRRSRLIVRTPLLLLGSLAAGACGSDADPTSADELANSTYLSDATGEGVVTLVSGAFDFPPGSGIERVELVSSARGDFDGNEDTDAAVVLVEYRNREEFYRIHALLGDGGAVEDVAARLLGDRVVIENLRIADGIIEVDLLVRAPGTSVEDDPTLPITSRYALTDRGLTPINPPTIKPGAAPTMDAGSIATLSSHEWILRSIEMGDWSQSTDALEMRPSLRFSRELGTPDAASGRVSGYAGCNQVFGSYSTDTGLLKISALGATRRMCEQDLADLEQRVIASLTAAESFQITDDQLVIEFNGGVMRFAAGSELDPPETIDGANPRGLRAPVESRDTEDGEGRQT